MIEDIRLLRFYIHLSERQREVVELAAEGLSNSEIARRLYIQPSVVAGHLTNIYGELGKLDELAQLQPNRYLLIRLLAPFFDRHPELRDDNAGV